MWAMEQYLHAVLFDFQKKQRLKIDFFEKKKKRTLDCIMVNTSAIRFSSK